MLLSLKIKNIALIDEIDIEFTAGLNILSGETGSGKSVVIDALNFVLGAKADKTLISFGQPFCAVTASFDVSDLSALKETMEELALEYEDTIVITRRYFVDGKGDIRINGTPVSAGMLRKITSYLVDVHGQSEHFYLLKESNQLALIDKVCGEKLDALKRSVSEEYEDYKKTKEIWEELGGDEHARAIRADILKYQIEEIENAALTEGEEEELLARRKKIVNAEKIATALSGAGNALGGDGGAVDAIQNALHLLRSVAAFSDEFAALTDRLESVKCEAEDIYESISTEQGEEYSPYELEEIENRLDLLKKLHLKYGKTFFEIQDFLQKSKAEYDKIIHFDELSEEYRSRLEKSKEKLYRLYVKMSNLRREAAKTFSADVVKELSELGMKNASFDIAFADLPDIGNISIAKNGADSIEFLFSANVGEPMKPMAKIISGGEISRFMLAMKTAVKTHEISTFVFDEIDAGISGRIAATVAEKFAKIARTVQVIAITHLPQISAMSDNSLLIFKKEENGKTHTFIKRLSDSEKIKEVLRLVGGSEESAAALQHAKEMIAAADRFKNTLS